MHCGRMTGDGSPVLAARCTGASCIIEEDRTHTHLVRFNAHELPHRKPNLMHRKSVKLSHRKLDLMHRKTNYDTGRYI